MNWFWSSGSTSSPENSRGGNDDNNKIEDQQHRQSDGHDQSHLTLLGGDDHSAAAAAAQPSPMFMLDQMKLAGVPLKAQMSPYLQIDPSIFRETQPQIILPEGYESGRGKFEFYMGYIGCAVAGGFMTGSMRGALGEFGNAQTKQLLLNTKNFTSSRPWMTRVLNAATKHGSGYAQTAGTAMFIYCVTELAIKHTRAEMFGAGDDLLNSFAGATLAGALYRMPHGMKASALGAAFGMGLMGAWTLVDSDSRRALTEMAGKGFLR